MKKFLVVLPLLFLAVSCGPIIGQMMKMSEGVKSFEVIEGNLAFLKKNPKILVVGPFAKAPGAYYIARGDEAAAFAFDLDKQNGITSDIYIKNRLADAEKIAASLRAMSGAEIKNKLGISFEPGIIMTGTILERKTIVAPTRGIIMEVGYRLEFFNTADQSKTVVNVAVKDHFKDCVKTVVGELLAQATN